MNQLDKEEGELGKDAQNGDPLPEPKMIKLDVDDPNIRHITNNQVEDGTGNPSSAVEDGTENPSSAVEDGYEGLSVAEFLSRTFLKRGPKTREEEYEWGMLKVFDKRLAERGVDVKKMRDRWNDCEVMCGLCGFIDYHPENECPDGEFIYM